MKRYGRLENQMGSYQNSYKKMLTHQTVLKKKSKPKLKPNQAKKQANMQTNGIWNHEDTLLSQNGLEIEDLQFQFDQRYTSKCDDSVHLRIITEKLETKHYLAWKMDSYFQK